MEYKCLTKDFEQLTKKINRITKKLDKHGLTHSFKALKEEIELVNVYDYTDIYNIKKLDPIACNVTYYEFSMDKLKIGEFQAIAVLDHTQGEENLVYSLIEGMEIDKKYRTVSCGCEHCNNNRQRNKTVLLQDVQGNIKQVGTTCIKEYTGIDALDVLRAYSEVSSIIIQECSIDCNGEYFKGGAKFVNSKNYLASCIQLINEKGYCKEGEGFSTKEEGFYSAMQGGRKEEDLVIAQNIIDYFATNDFKNDFMHNTKIILTNEYSKINGFIAYAFLAYNKQLEFDVKEKIKNTINRESEFQFNVKDKVELKLTLKGKFGYETQYGYINIFIFNDSENNVFVWRTSTNLPKDLEKNTFYGIGDNLTIKCTVKEHIEYKEVKQTILTRCKVIEG